MTFFNILLSCFRSPRSWNSSKETEALLSHEEAICNDFPFALLLVGGAAAVYGQPAVGAQVAAMACNVKNSQVCCVALLQIHAG